MVQNGNVIIMKNNLMTLRPYQTSLSYEVRKALSKNKSVLMCLPTGMGKTIIATDFAERSSKKGLVSVFLSDRKEILEQTARAFNSHGIDYQIITAQTKSIDHCKCYIAMVETFFRRYSKGWFDNINIDVIICDEAHMGNYKKVIKELHDKYIIGLTATPASEGLNKLYKTIVLGPDVGWGIENKFLVPSIDIGQQHIFDLKKQNGEFTAASQRVAFDEFSVNNVMFKLFTKHASNRQTIVFNIDIDHNNEVVELFKNNGINAAAINSKMPTTERDKIVSLYRNKEIQVLCNVEIATKGFDNPETQCIILNRGTDSVMLYYQMVGRGGRPCEGKENFVVIDMCNNILRHGSYNEGVDWKYLFDNNETKTKYTRPPLRLCPVCYAYIYNIHSLSCTVCKNPISIKTLLHIESQIPKELLNKPIGEMTMKELNMYGKYKGYKNPSGWAFHVMSNNRKFRK